MTVFRTIGKGVFRSSRYCVLLLGVVVCSTCAYAVPPDEIGWGWRTKPTVKKRRFLATVILAQNRAGLELPNVVTLNPGKLPIGADGVHYNSDFGPAIVFFGSEGKWMFAAGRPQPQK